MEDIFGCIFTYLNVKELIACSLSCKMFYKIAMSKKLWKILLTQLNTNFYDESEYNTYKIIYILKNFVKEYDTFDKIYVLTCLKLYEKEIKIIPPEIKVMIKLKTIVLDNNRITIIPPEIGKLINLESMWMRYNNIKIIPPEIGNYFNIIIPHPHKFRKYVDEV